MFFTDKEKELKALARLNKMRERQAGKHIDNRGTQRKIERDLRHVKEGK